MFGEPCWHWLRRFHLLLQRAQQLLPLDRLFDGFQINLLHETQFENVNQAIRDIIQLVLTRYPSRLLSVYLAGSYANNYQVPTSDIDLLFIFDNPLTEQEDDDLCDEIYEYRQANKTPLYLDNSFYGLAELKQQGLIEMATYYRHLWGQQIHHQIPNPDIKQAAYSAMHDAYERMAFTRKSKPYRWPLGFPNEGEFKGYDCRTIPLDGKPVTSIKELVVLTGRMCKGLINWKYNIHVPTKQACPILFSHYFLNSDNNEPAEAFSEISHYCREQFHYLIPEKDEDKKRLQELLPKALALENFFLSQYQDFLIENLANPDPQKVFMSIKRLGEVMFPNSKSVQALSSLATKSSAQGMEINQCLERLSVLNNSLLGTIKPG